MKMKTSCILILALLTILITGCSALPTNTPDPTALDLRKQPEPGEPRIFGEVSGVTGDTLVTIYVQTPQGRKTSTITRRGNGIWEAVVTDVSGSDYVVTAEVVGYVSDPAFYTIHIEGKKAYLVENGQVTSNEAGDLDFNFDPVPTTTPTE